jgi:hypothetical protein
MKNHIVTHMVHDHHKIFATIFFQIVMCLWVECFEREKIIIGEL